MQSGCVGGCNFPVDPILDLPEAQVFWQPLEDTSVVVLASTPDPLVTGAEGKPDLLQTMPLISEEGAEAFIDLGKGQRLQVNSNGSGTLVAAIPLGIDGFDRIESVLRLLAAIHRRAIPPDTRLTAQQKARSHRMLQAFDGLRDGATQRDIAQVLFGIGQLGRDEWQASSARHRVMSYLRDARSIIAGGYRRLLRHSRRR
jgi:hypothetical protein